MSETLNNNENINHGGAEGYQAPPFDPAAADAARREEINKIQLEQAPGTETDPDKAFFMALAGDYHADKRSLYNNNAAVARVEAGKQQSADLAKEKNDYAEGWDFLAEQSAAKKSQEEEHAGFFHESLRKDNGLEIMDEEIRERVADLISKAEDAYLAAIREEDPDERKRLLEIAKENKDLVEGWRFVAKNKGLVQKK